MNRRSFISIFLICLIILITPELIGRCSAQVRLAPSAHVTNALAFTGSPDATGTVDRQQVRLCFSIVMQRLKLPENELPKVLVIHASRDVAEVADVHKTTIRRNAGTDSAYYEFWIVGQPQPSDCILAAYAILEKHFKIQISEEQQKKTALFVFRFMSSTVSAHGGH
jgi:hypothetical protein